jgi:hypothetical protein
MRVRPIPVVSMGSSEARKGGPIELEQVSASAPPRREARAHGQGEKDAWWKTALRAVAVCGGMVIIAVVLVVDRRSSRR